MGVAQSIILYGSPVWGEVVRIAKYRKIVDDTQRYPTGPIGVQNHHKGTAVIARVPPMDINLNIDRRIGRLLQFKQGESKADVKARSIIKWQQRWEKFERCSTIDQATDKEYRGVDKMPTRNGKIPDGNCCYCGGIDSPAPTIFDCARWDREKLHFQMDYDADDRIDAQNIHT
ncbi:hypothetical protein JTB14_006053 [Gonioctena quinquepunctata]|nr:hypothetical protein JTB14_006053 [Gonioctena quinquepunctata]